MPQGLAVYDASGNEIFSVTDRIGRVLGTATLTNPTDGSVTNAGFATGTPYAICVPIVNGDADIPNLSWSGNTLSWDFVPGGQYVTTYKLTYGVY